MGHDQFATQLAAEGLQPTIHADCVTFDYPIPVGAHAGETVTIALHCPDFPANPPGGPHLTPGFAHPGGNNHASPLRSGWIYWSRPFPGWAQTDRTASDYLAHLRRLFSQFEASSAA
jgi:hypothetical protein